MLRMLGMGMLAIALCLTAAVADDDDKVMGNYAGEFVSGDLTDVQIRAQVPATSKLRWKGIFFLSQDGKEEIRVEVKGKKRKEEDKVAKFSGTVDLGKALGGEYKMSGEIANEVFTGKFEGKKKDASFELKRVFIKPPTLGMAAPEGAIVLLDGKSAEGWNLLPHWQMQGDGSIMIKHSNLITKQEFGPAQYHIEFKCPFMPNDKGQARGNSGVYIFGRYEVQVLDCFGDEPADNRCGGIYKKAVPTSCESLPPLQWQTYDITFHPPVFDAQGAKTADARITAVHNGVTIHDDVTLAGPTPGGITDQEGPTGPLMFQDHGNAVSYRNVWVKPLQ